MLNAQALGECADSGFELARQAVDREQRLVLLRFDACRACGFFAEGEEFTDLVAKLSKGAVVRQADLRHRALVSGAQRTVNWRGSFARDRSLSASHADPERTVLYTRLRGGRHRPSPKERSHE